MAERKNKGGLWSRKNKKQEETPEVAQPTPAPKPKPQPKAPDVTPSVDEVLDAANQAIKDTAPDFGELKMPENNGADTAPLKPIDIPDVDDGQRRLEQAQYNPNIAAASLNINDETGELEKPVGSGIHQREFTEQEILEDQAADLAKAANKSADTSMKNSLRATQKKAAKEDAALMDEARAEAMPAKQDEYVKKYFKKNPNGAWKLDTKKYDDAPDKEAYVQSILDDAKALGIDNEQEIRDEIGAHEKSIKQGNFNTKYFTKDNNGNDALNFDGYESAPDKEAWIQGLMNDAKEAGYNPNEEGVRSALKAYEDAKAQPQSTEPAETAETAEAAPATTTPTATDSKPETTATTTAETPAETKTPAETTGNAGLKEGESVKDWLLRQVNESEKEANDAKNKAEDKRLKTYDENTKKLDAAANRQIAGIDDILKELKGLRDAKEQTNSRSEMDDYNARVFGASTEAVASIINLLGTTAGASSQTIQSPQQQWAQRADAMRRERDNMLNKYRDQYREIQLKRAAVQSGILQTRAQRDEQRAEYTYRRAVEGANDTLKAKINALASAVRSQVEADKAEKNGGKNTSGNGGKALIDTI